MKKLKLYVYRTGDGGCIYTIDEKSGYTLVNTKTRLVADGHEHMLQRVDDHEYITHCIDVEDRDIEKWREIDTPEDFL